MTPPAVPRQELGSAGIPLAVEFGEIRREGDDQLAVAVFVAPHEASGEIAAVAIVAGFGEFTVDGLALIGKHVFADDRAIGRGFEMRLGVREHAGGGKLAAIGARGRGARLACHRRRGGCGRKQQRGGEGRACSQRGTFGVSGCRGLS